MEDTGLAGVDNMDQKGNFKGSATNAESMATWLVSVVKDSLLGTQ